MANSSEIDEGVIKYIQSLAQEGKVPCEIIRGIGYKLGLDGNYRIAVVIHMMHAFSIPLEVLQQIGAWVGFGGGRLSDDEVNSLLKTYIPRPSKDSGLS